MILDAGGILALARQEGLARAALDRAIHEGYVVVIPTPVLAQVHRGGRDRAQLDRILKAVDAFLPTSERVARRAGELLAKTGTSDVVDAIVAAEALASLPPPSSRAIRAIWCGCWTASLRSGEELSSGAEPLP
jgi:predicted nucleic acid-binding protein